MNILIMHSTALHPEVTTVPTSVQQLISALLRCTQIITWISVLIMSFCTAHIQQSSSLQTHHKELCNVCGELRRSADEDRRCGLVCLMVTCRGNTERVRVGPVGNQKKMYSCMNRSKIDKGIKKSDHTQKNSWNCRISIKFSSTSTM